MRRLIPIVVLAVLLTGCKVKIDQGFELSNDGSGTASITFGFDEELNGLLESFAQGEDPFDQMTSQLPPGWEANDWSQGEFSGMQASTEFADLNELRSLASTVFSGEDGLFSTFSIEETADGGFRFEAAINSESIESEMQGLEGFGMDGSLEDLSGSFFDAEVTARFPGEVISHNADRQESDGTLVWRLNLIDSGRVIRAESAPTGGLPLMPMAAGAAVLLAVGLGVAIWKRRSGSDVTYDEEYVAPVAPVTAGVEGDPFG